MSPRSALFWCAFLAVLFVPIGAAIAGSMEDGPYVLQNAEGNWVAQWVTPDNAGAEARHRSVRIGHKVAAPAVGGLPGLKVRLREPVSEADGDDVSVPNASPIFVLADTHGEFEILAELLQKQRVVDSRLRWSFGRGHLVFLGDVFDRGAHQIEILWLIYKLEGEAAKAGGGVHLLLGNHEAMVLRGDLRYLNPKYLETAKALGVESYAELFGPNALLGQWLRSKPAVFKLNDLLLLHGGISPELLERGLSLATINGTVRGVLDGTVDADGELAQFVMKSAGPLWYRGYFALKDAPPAATRADIEATLRHFGVGTILVGHTPVPTITPLYDGKVIAVQVYPHRDEKTGDAVMEGAVREGGVWYRARIDGTREPLLAEVSSSK